MPVASYRSIVGLALETAEGTPVAPTDFLPVTTMSATEPITYQDDTAWRGSMVEQYDTIKGASHSEVDFGGPVFADTIGFLLGSLLPDVVTTGASAPFSHVFSALNSGNGQPQTLTLTDYNGVTTRQYPGLKVSDLGLKFTADGLLEYTAKAVGRSSSTTTAPTASYSPVRAQAGWAAAFKVGGTSRIATDFVMDGELDFKRAVTPINGITGTASPSAIWSGALAVSGKLTLMYDTDQDVAAYLAGTQEALELSWTDLTANVVTLHMTQGQFSNAVVDRGSDYVKVNVDFRALANTSDIGASNGFSPVKATLVNSVASGHYQ